MQKYVFCQNKSHKRRFTQSSLIAMVMIFLLMVIKSQSGNKYTFRTSMQSTNGTQTFMTYVPFVQTCNYTNPYISPGTITSQQMTPLNLFEYYQSAQRIAFWSSIQNGLDIFMVEQQLYFDGYNKIIYRPQVFNLDQNQISSNNTNDIVTLFKIDSDGSLLVVLVEVYIQRNSNFTLSVTPVPHQTFNVTISPQLRNLTQNCMNNNISQIVISQLDNTHYIGACKNTNNIFFWSLNPLYKDTIIQLPQSDYQMPINQMILNPVLQEFGVSQIGWNVFLLTNQSTQTYSCQFDPLTPQNFTCLDSSELGDQFQLLLEKLWSEQDNLQEVKLQRLLNHIGPKGTQQFPGSINSIFIDPQDNIYVQSIVTDPLTQIQTTYLNIFNWQKKQIMNISLNGKILLYNSLQFLVWDNQSQNYNITTVILPFMSFGMNDLSNVSVNSAFFNLTIDCIQVQDIEFNIQFFFSTYDYPTGYTFEDEQPTVYSELNIYTFQIQNFFSIFGPGYTIYFKGPNSLSANLLDASIISMGTYILSIVELLISESTSGSIFRSPSMVYTSQNTVHYYSGGTQIHSQIIKNPCGIKYGLRGIKMTNGQALYYGYFMGQRQELIYCLCPTVALKDKKCNQMQKSQVKKGIISSGEKLSSKIHKLNNLKLLTYDQDLQNVYCGDSCINNRLYTLVDTGLVVSTFNNNSAVLSVFPPSIQTSNYLDQVNVTCDSNGELVGSLFNKQFADPSMFLFCQQDEFINQYKIRQNKFIFQRKIPLYGFVTRKQAANILTGKNFIYVEVKINPNSQISINIDPTNPLCCVLRIDPFADTVSAIQQVIFSRNVQHVYHYSGVDVAYYQGSEVTSDDSFLKIYLGQNWLSLRQTDFQTPVQSYNFTVVFSSINYNLASQFNVSIMYNMTSLGLKSNNDPIESVIQLEGVIINSLPQIYEGKVSFNYNGVQGPIRKTSINSSDSPEMIEDVKLNEIIVKTKIIGEVGNNYLQIFTPMDGNTNTTFDNSIILIGSTYIAVYLKYFANQQMYLVKKFNTKYPDCEYFPYTIINSTTIQFVSECAVPEFNFQTPNLTMNLVIHNSSNATLNYNQKLTTISVRLSDLKTLVFQNITLGLGMDQGPLQSITGKLKYCSSLNECSDLYISSKQYDVLIYNKNQFIVATLDSQEIQIWINPEYPSNGTTIPSNWTISLNSYVKQDISVITLIDANSTSFTAILSGTLKYYEVVYLYGKNMKIVKTYQRYGNCEQFDKFPVSVLMDDNGEVAALVTECGQNQDTLRLQMYERISFTDVVIYSGYLQYFTKSGPLSYLTTDQVPCYNPIRLLPLSTTMINKLFMIYTSQNGQYIKLIYQQIDGIMADNILSLTPSLSINLSPLTTDLDFPTLNFTIYNDFYSLIYSIQTKQAPLNQITTLQFSCIIVFIVCNAFNIIVMIFYWIYAKQKQPKKVVERQSLVAKSWDDEEHSPRGFGQFKRKFKQRITGFSLSSRKQTLQIRRPSDARKPTQIQLFTRRSE